LDTQYRMHPSLATFVSTCFYRGKYLSGVADAKRPQPRGLRWPSPSCNAALLVSGSGEEGAGQSKRNPGEASAVVSLLRDLRPAEVGVVTPYGAQVGLLRQQVSSLPGGREIEVKSVDGFQGREKELIVFSAVRSNRSGSLGFVSDARRLNVMLTRAKRGLVIVGDPTTLVRSRHWADWLEWIEGQRAVL
ncbi:hypothetical protein EMIHUDRAFT_44663, partial [Emiliania huxleyi CCMP1516]|uniref:DNA2/NAM7 helicase-like C-terminal domain-containing protein n=2 Tax=Emiliania huxleyi TaxID=2903 RepID=A0A0D3IRK3_EMIH1